MKHNFISPGLIIALLLSSAGCASVKKAATDKSSMSRCLEELSVIPEMAVLQEARKSAGERGARPLEGMHIALTINGMISSNVDPEADPDDLCYAQNTRENFDKIIDALVDNQMPPIVEFAVGSEMDLRMQEEWLRKGNLIGNMTYARRRIKKLSAEQFTADIARNEEALAPLWQKFPLKRRYFRFPNLKLGRDDQKQQQIRAYLAQKGYIEVPATIDARDGLFAQLYCAAQARGDRDCENYIKANYFSLLIDKTIRARAKAAAVAGRDIKHILMVRAHQLTCDTLNDLLKRYSSMGATFITLDEALRDPFYASGSKKSDAYAVVKATKRAQVAAGRQKD